MTSKRDLGPPLAIAGGGVAVAAIIAGFIVVGGPGDAREQRLHHATMMSLVLVASTVECAFNQEGAAASSIEEARNQLARLERAKPGSASCDVYGVDGQNDEVEYSRLAGDRIRLCATFRVSFDPGKDHKLRARFYDTGARDFPELLAAHPKGRHCYDIQLVKPAPQAAN